MKQEYQSRTTVRSEARSATSSPHTAGEDIRISAPLTNEKNVRQKGDRIRATDIVRVRGGVDRPMLIIVILLLCFGTVMVFSASYSYALYKYGDSYYFIKRQLLFLALGSAAMVAAIHFVDYRLIYRLTIPFFIGCTALLIVTPIIGLAQGVARRWIIIAGIRFQPSELMKIGLVLMLAWYFSKFQDAVLDYRDFKRSSVYGDLLPILLTGFVCILIMLENHFSCMIIMFMIGMVVTFAAGARKFWFGIAGGAAAILAGIAISFSGYARERVDVWLHPENYSALDETWQTLQGLYAVGSGGLLGVGLGNSRQKHLFVSEPQNDFIFSIICEELGFVGAMAVILLFLAFAWRGIVIALKAPDTFSKLVVIGIVGHVVIQAFLNIAVVTSLIPNTGISLPFFSYGGTSLSVLMAEMGLLLSISRYSYEQKPSSGMA